MSDDRITAVVSERERPDLPRPLTIHDKVVAHAVVAGPVFLLILLGIGFVGLGLFFSVLVWSVLVSEQLASRYDAAVNALILFIIFAGPGCIPLIGGLLLRKFRGRSFVVLASFVAMLLPPFVPGILAFLWTLKALREPLIDRCFREPIQPEITPIPMQESIPRWPNNFD
jgi:MFS family permease